MKARPPHESHAGALHKARSRAFSHPLDVRTRCPTSGLRHGRRGDARRAHADDCRGDRGIVAVGASSKCAFRDRTARRRPDIEVDRAGRRSRSRRSCVVSPRALRQRDDSQRDRDDLRARSRHAIDAPGPAVKKLASPRSEDAPGSEKRTSRRLRPVIVPGNDDQHRSARPDRRRNASTSASLALEFLTSFSRSLSRASRAWHFD